MTNTNDGELREQINDIVLDCLNTSFNGGKLNPLGHDYKDTCVDRIQSLLARRELKTRIEELEQTVFAPLQGRTWLNVRPDIELQRITKRLYELRDLRDAELSQRDEEKDTVLTQPYQSTKIVKASSISHGEYKPVFVDEEKEE